MRQVYLYLMKLSVAAMLTACSAGSDVDPVSSVTADTQRVTVTMTELKFTPATITLVAGKPVEILAKNTGSTEHDLTIIGMPAENVRTAGRDPSRIAGHAKAKKDVRIVFTPTQSGTYAFFCSIPGHKDGGMSGTIEVT